jgi:hypothetical protein
VSVKPPTQSGRARLLSDDLAEVTTQRHRAIILLWTGAARTAAWVTLGIFIALGLAHIGAFDWASDLSKSIAFVALISIYANAATDFDAATAAFAALVAADAHKAAATVARHQLRETEALATDVSRLADLQPGPEAAELADDIRHRLRPGTRRG